MREHSRAEPGLASWLPLGRPLLDALERMRCGGIILDATGAVLQFNQAAESLLVRELGPPREPPVEAEWVRDAVKTLLRRAPDRFTLNSDYWAMIPRQEERPLALHAVPVAEFGEPGPHTLVILIDLGHPLQPSAAALERMFALTEAEAKLAIQIAGGSSPADIAAQNNVAIATIRSQLSSVFAKTQTRGQPELIALLARVSILP